jgi:rhomboid family GlyGly-CTERM serine protease
MPDGAASARTHGFSIGVALLCAALAFAPEASLAQMEFDRSAIRAGQLWRLWSGHLVHYSAPHALGDALVLLAAGLSVERALGPRRWLLVLLLSMPLISVGLLLAAPALTHYRGASAIAVLAVALAGSVYWRAHPGARPFIACMGLVLAAKTLGDALGYSPGAVGLPADVAVAWQAHVFGALAALAIRPKRQM